MKAKDLIEILELNPEGEVGVVTTYYDGNSEITRIDDTFPQVITNGDIFVIVAEDWHDKQSAIEALSDPSIPYREINKLAESKEPVIYMD